jgi:GT2 family glycosyltransferase
VIWFFKPYSFEANIGKAYNDYMRLIPSPEDWGVLLDGDTCFLTHDWGHAIQEAINRHPDAGLFTCTTNRVANRLQARAAMFEQMDLRRQALYAMRADRLNRGKSNQTNSTISGLMMAIKKSTWDKQRFPERDDKILNVDHVICRQIMDAGKKIYIMQGVYMLHVYRVVEGRQYTKHLRKNVPATRIPTVKKLKPRVVTRRLKKKQNDRLTPKITPEQKRRQNERSALRIRRELKIKR